MRRFVRDRVAAALERARPLIEQFIPEHIECPDAFPFRFAPAGVTVREIRSIKLSPLTPADLPPVQVEVMLKANGVVQVVGGWDPGPLDLNLVLTVHGTVNPDGTYGVEPRSVALTA